MSAVQGTSGQTTVTVGSDPNKLEPEEDVGYLTDNLLIPPLDYSFLRLVQDTDVFDEEPRNTSPRKEKIMHTEEGKSPGRCLKLNNNSLTNIENLEEVVSKLFDQPEQLGWIDLSFNALTNVSTKLLMFKELQILYLHGNDIGDLSEIQCLSALPKLRKLTLHGNPIENEQGYRMQVLSMLPNLTDLDFSLVTKGDRSRTNFWARSVSKRKTKKKSSD